MAVLSDVNIEEIMEKNKGIIIANMRKENLTALGYDFTIGFICDSDVGNEPTKVECIFDTESKKEYLKEDIINDRQLREEYEKYKGGDRYRSRFRYKLEPGARYLVMSEEYLALCKYYMATLHSRGSYALKGILVTSTTIDPNYSGFVYASLINCSTGPVYIKEHNQFATMVVHMLAAPTERSLPKAEKGGFKDAEQTLDGRFSNICEKASTAAKTHRADAWKNLQEEYLKKHDAFINQEMAASEKQPSRKARLIGFGKKLSGILTSKKFWIIFITIIVLAGAYISGGVEKLVEIGTKLVGQFLPF